MIPNLVHFVFGFEDHPEPFHFLQYVAIESCRRVVRPEAIYLHHHRPPSGRWWERVADAVTLVEVDLVPEVLSADYSAGHVPGRYRYAHHADFVRLDALLERGGIYADLDTVFLRAPSPELYRAPFVIGREGPVIDEVTGESRPSLCNAFLMAEPKSRFARAWREEMPAELNGTWSNHSGFLARSLTERLPDAVRVEPEVRFFPISSTPTGIRGLLEERRPVAGEAVSVHLWAHLWWRRERRDHSVVHAGWCTPEVLGIAETTLSDLVRPYLPPAPPPETIGGGKPAGPRPASSGAQTAAPGAVAARPEATGASSPSSPGRWTYCSFDGPTGYGTAADRCRDALGAAGADLRWVPFVPGPSWDLAFEPPEGVRPFPSAGRRADEVVVGHLVPEYLPRLRSWCGDEAFLVGHTAWETDRIPAHWAECLAVADLIVVPSAFSSAAFAAAGLDVPIEVVPHVAPPAPRPGRSRFDDLDPGRHVFYTIGEWTPRKALEATVEAYLRAFRGDDPVLLVVKTTPRDPRAPEPASAGRAGRGSAAFAVAQLLARHPDHAPVSLITDVLSDDEIAGLHARGDCFVSLSRGEGFGLGAFDAAIGETPVVVTGWGGQLDFLAGSPYLVDSCLVPVEDPLGFPSFTRDQRWAEADLDHAAALLRRVVAEREEAVAEATRRAAALRARHAPAAVAAAFQDAVARWLDPRRAVGPHGQPGPTR